MVSKTATAFYEGTVARVGDFSITASRSVRNISVDIDSQLYTNKYYPL